MKRPLSMFLSSLVILGMIQLGCRVLAQSPKEITNSVGMKLVLIPKGSFKMGLSEYMEVLARGELQHEVSHQRGRPFASSGRAGLVGGCCGILQDALGVARGEESRSRVSPTDRSGMGIRLRRWH
jgi:hypothetical protein